MINSGQVRLHRIVNISTGTVLLVQRCSGMIPNGELHLLILCKKKLELCLHRGPNPPDFWQSNEYCVSVKLGTAATFSQDVVMLNDLDCTKGMKWICEVMKSKIFEVGEDTNINNIEFGCALH
jgi:hypothetical protein